MVTDLYRKESTPSGQGREFGVMVVQLPCDVVGAGFTLHQTVPPKGEKKNVYA